MSSNSKSLSLRSSIGEAIRDGVIAARQNWTAMTALLMAMAVVVAAYYCWPTATSALSWFGHWEHAGGLFRIALTAGFAGGIISELSVIYVRDGGRWTTGHLENMLFRFIVFFFNGLIVAEFYEWQAVWFGQGTSWRVILPKVLVDQFIFTVFWSTPYQTLLFRWQALRYSGSRLWNELDGRFVVKRMLPMLVTNWMFWIPGVSLVYSMPLILQMPLSIFATAIWGLLAAALSNPGQVENTLPVSIPAAPKIAPQNEQLASNQTP